ncbi:MAG: hypothetical protein CSYNP_03483 [Syntrophus sp. SKADARSKE-3]|nr:hypothetical protein [Syntrophus sp. SKADARSKE-3]
MLPAQVTSMLKILEMMADLEMIISEFYTCAGDQWKEDSEFWTGLAKEEILHAENIIILGDILSRKPQAFDTGRPISISAINTVISGVKKNIEKLKNGLLNKKQTLVVSRDFEQSMLESKYAEILKSKDDEYLRLISEIVSQTESHKQLLFKRIEGL